VKTEIGIVKWFDNSRGFGFIAPEDGSKDLFVHHSEIQSDESHKKLKEKQRVSFVLGQGQKGPCATRVQVL